MSIEISWLVFGAGAIGTYIGGSLALSGQHVVFLERPELAFELRLRGLRLNLGTGELAIPQPEVAASLAEALEAGPFTAAIFALKSYDTSPALKILAPLADQMPPVLCLQNGVENESALAAVLGEKQVIPGTVTSSIGRRAIGNIVLERQRGLGIAAGHPLSEMLATGLRSAGLTVRLYPRAADMKWSKLLTNLLANASSAILDMTPAEIFAHPGLFRLEVAQLREALAVMAATGIQVVDLPGTPVRLLALAVQKLPLALTRPLLRRSVGRGRGSKMPSFHIDLHTGRGRSEVEYLNGAVWRFGSRHQVPTPVNALLTETLLALTSGAFPLDTYRRQPEKLLAALPALNL